jgi:Nickel uptake substrate-specific transmembrane region.
MKIIEQLKKVITITAFVFALNSVACTTAYAHARWVIPSHTVISGDKPMAVSIDYSISNDIFHPDMAFGGAQIANISAEKGQVASPIMGFMAKTHAQVTTPNGDTQVLNSVDLGRKSSTYFTAPKSGTYRVEITQPTIDIILFKSKDGESERLFGSYDSIKSKLPKSATDIEYLQLKNRIQTFVTLNQTSQKNVAPSGEGLELKHNTHPNELFAGEKSTYRLLLNGEYLGAKNSYIKITKGGTRFRNQRDSIEPMLFENGKFEITWPEAGFYLVEVEHEIKQAGSKLVYALFLTVEIHPE